MKRHFKHVSESGEVTLATVSIEEESVTVTRKAQGSRTKGKPIRIPRKLCREGDPAVEGRVRGLALLGEGFVFEREEDGKDLFSSPQGSYYYTLSKDRVRQLIDDLVQLGEPPGLTARRGTHELIFMDQDYREFQLHAGQGVSALVMANSPLSLIPIAALALGYGELVFSIDGTSTTAIEARELFAKTYSMPSAHRQYLEQAGVTVPGVAKAAPDQMRAVLI